MDAPLLSVTVPSLNEETYVGAALGSLHRDPFVRAHRERVEILLVDGGSADRTVEIARPYVDRVIETGWGKLRARNAGALAARAPILAWMDADVEVLPGSVGRLVARFDDPDVVAVVSRTRARTRGLDALRRAQGAFFPALRNVHGRFGAVRRDVFLAIGGFDESQDSTSLARMILEEQVGFGRRLARHGRIVWDPRVAHVHSDRRLKAALGGRGADAEYAASLGLERF